MDKYPDRADRDINAADMTNGITTGLKVREIKNDSTWWDYNETALGQTHYHKYMLCQLLHHKKDYSALKNYEQ